MSLSERNRYIAKATLLYGGLATFWIFLSDSLLAVFVDVAAIQRLSTVKGLLFVGVTTILLFAALRMTPDRPAAAVSENGDKAEGRLSPWLTYGAAIGLSLGVLSFRHAIAFSFHDHTLLIVFMFPVILSGIIGGIGPGLVATAIVGLGSAIETIPPRGTLWIAAPHDLFQWSFLIANGVLVSYLAEWLHRSRARALATRDADRNFRVLFESAAASIYVHDKDTGEIVAANRRAIETAKCQSLKELRKADIWFDPPYSFADVRRLVRLTAASGPQRVEWKNRDRDGQVFWEDVQLNPVVLDGVERVVAIAHDITDRKLAEFERHHLAEALRQSAQPMVMGDTEGRIFYANPAFSTLLGYGPGELIGRPIRDICPADAASRTQQDEAVRTARETGQWSGEVLRLAKDGTTVPFHLDLATIREPSGGLIGFVASFLDLRPLLARERSLRESEERLRLIFEATDEGLWDWDLRTGKAVLSPRYWEMTGYEPGEVEADFDFFKRLVHPEDLPGVQATMEAHLRGTTPESVIEYRMVTKGGKIKRILGRGRVVARDAAGAPLRMLGSIADVTGRKADEESLKRQEADLRRRNEELERFNRVSVGRELEMIDLKRRINDLSRELGREAPYDLGFADDSWGEADGS